MPAATKNPGLKALDAYHAKIHRATKALLQDVYAVMRRRRILTEAFAAEADVPLNSAYLWLRGARTPALPNLLKLQAWTTKHGCPTRFTI